MGRAEEIEKKVIFNYLEKRMGLIASGREFKLSQREVEKILKKYGVRKRSYTEAKQKGRKYKCNDNFFKTQNSNMGYILGLIASDGNVSKKENLVSIQLLEQDKEILEKIIQITESSRPLKFYTRKETGHNIATLKVWSKTWKDDLAHFGIVPNKTFTLMPPDFLSPEYRIDYIRGYFDGNGSIYEIEAQNRVFFEIAGAAKTVIEWIHNELVNNCHIVANKPTKETLTNGTIMYKIKIGDKEELKKLYTLLYKDKKLYMQRKKDKFSLLLNIPRDFNSSIEE